MRKKMVAGNWKMCGTRESVKSLLITLRQHFPQHCDVDVIVFPSFVYLAETQSLLSDSAIAWGAQNVNDHENGAFTGEISAPMLSDLGCQYVLIGHSERRAYYQESSDFLLRKCLAAQQVGLTPIFCVGETEDQYNDKQTESVIANQLAALFTSEYLPYLRSTIIAYEPVWAIGTGKTATPDIAQSVHAFIRAQIALHDKNIANTISILYGGSVKADNAASLFSMPDIDGGLVGGASLDPHAFLGIITCNSSF